MHAESVLECWSLRLFQLAHVQVRDLVDEGKNRIVLGGDAHMIRKYADLDLCFLGARDGAENPTFEYNVQHKVLEFRRVTVLTLLQVFVFAGSAAIGKEKIFRILKKQLATFACHPRMPRNTAHIDCKVVWFRFTSYAIWQHTKNLML